MPNYTYSCPKCHNERQEFHGMNDAPTVTCGICNTVCIKLIGAGASIIFRGEGFPGNDMKKSGEQIKKIDKKSGDITRLQ